MSRWMQSIWENGKANSAKLTSQLPNHPQQASHFCSQERYIYTSPHSKSHIYCSTVTPQFWEYISLKRRNGLCPVASGFRVFWASRSSGSWDQIWKALKKRAKPVFWVIPIICLYGKDSALFILTKYIYHTEKKDDLFLPRGSYSLAKLCYISILVFCVETFYWAWEIAQCIDCFLSKPEDLTLDFLQKSWVWQCKHGLRGKV